MGEHSSNPKRAREAHGEARAETPGGPPAGATEEMHNKVKIERPRATILRKFAVKDVTVGAISGNTARSQTPR